MRIKYSIVVLICFIFSVCEAQQFKEVSLSKGINHRAGRYFCGVIVFDYNNDDWDDIFFTSGLFGANNKLYKNDHGTFIDVTVASGLDILNQNLNNTVGGASADLDNDGDRDLIITKYSCNGAYCNISFFRNNGDGTFTDITSSTGINMNLHSKSVAFGDVNKDGFLDIYFSNYDKGTHYTYDSMYNINGYNVECFDNYFYLNNGNMTFTDKTNEYHINNSGCTHTSIFTDFDNDNNIDLLVSNDFGEWFSWRNALYKNNYPTPGFSNLSVSSNMDIGLFSMGIASGDYDNDGDLDYYFTNIGKNKFMKNNGNGSFSNVASFYNVENEWSVKDTAYQNSWGCNFFDADNDGDLDLFVATGWFNIDFPYTGPYTINKLYRNENSGLSFTDVSVSAGVNNPLTQSGCALIDYNNDGKLDLVLLSSAIARPGQTADSTHSLLYENITTPDKNYIKIKLEGTRSNRDGFGSRIEVFANNKKYIREVESGGNSHSSQNTSYNHFGLGSISVIDSIKIKWVSGIVQTLTNIPVNQTLKIKEDTSILSGILNNRINKLKIYPNIISSLYDLHIELSSSETIAYIEITDIQGNNILSYKNSSNLHRNYFSFDKIENFNYILNNGIYFIKVISDKNELYVSKIIVQK